MFLHSLERRYKTSTYGVVDFFAVVLNAHLLAHGSTRNKECKVRRSDRRSRA